MKIEDKNKVDILLSALKERYGALQEIRQRVQSIGLWALGLLMGASAWVFQTDSIFTFNQKLLGCTSIVVAAVVMRFYLGDLRAGYRRQQRILVEIETELGMFSPGAFLSHKRPLYPEKWLHSGTPKAQGRFFLLTYVFIYVGAAVLLSFIVSNGYF